MSTAQMTQAAPRMMNDVHPPMASPQPSADSIQAQMVNNLPVQNQAVDKSIGFNPIMSSEQHDSPSRADNVLHAASHAVHSQENVDKKKAHSDTGPKPILETVLILVGSLVACGIVAVMFSSS